MRANPLDKILPFVWAASALGLALLVMAVINDAICPIQNYDHRFLVCVAVFLTSFLIPWAWRSIRTTGRTPLAFDAGIPWLLAFLLLHLERRMSSFRDFYEVDDWIVVHLPMIGLSYALLAVWRRRGGRIVLRPVVAITVVYYVLLQCLTPRLVD